MTVIHDIAWLQERHKWAALKTVIIIESTREIGSKTERETRFHISSLNLPADKLGPIIRSRWAVENSLHSPPPGRETGAGHEESARGAGSDPDSSPKKSKAVQAPLSDDPVVVRGR